MGTTRVTIRTLSSGEKVYHYPPDEEFPEGRMVLIQPEETAMMARINAHREADEEALRDLHAANAAKVEQKMAAEAADPAVPPEKRFL